MARCNEKMHHHALGICSVWRIRKIENISKIQNVRIFKTIHKLTFILDTGFISHDDLTDKIYQKYASAGTEVCVSLWWRNHLEVPGVPWCKTFCYLTLIFCILSLFCEWSRLEVQAGGFPYLRSRFVFKGQLLKTANSG